MTSLIPFESIETIVELGAGTGAITKAIIKRKKKETTLIVFEPDDHFFSFLKEANLQTGKKVILIKDLAENLGKVLKSLEVNHPDCIVSSLPFTSLGEKNTTKIFQEIEENLAPDGHFILFQYTPYLFPVLAKHFRIRTLSFVPFNLPPAFVIECALLR
ncbi:MAG: methyltransferase domain-containing protein [Firmicutes bacterium]|nr:methyltransferase domain-containing protein [Bacillota bacterium]